MNHTKQTFNLYIMQKAIDIQNNILQIADSDQAHILIEEYKKLDQIYEQHQHQLEQIKLIHTTCKQLIHSKIKRFRTEMNIICNPAKITQDELKYLSSSALEDNMKEVAPGIKLPVVTVDHVDNIPDVSFLYHVKNTDTFGIKLLGQTLTGRIGNIVVPSNNNKKHIRCHKNHPPQFDHIKNCPKYHPHLDEPFSWSNSSWLYTPHSNKKNKTMRHIGSRDTLLIDIWKAEPSELKQRKQQFIHDLLIQACISKSCTDVS